MASQSALVTDTNFWIDLDNGGILVEVFRLPYRFFAPDLAIPELIQPRWETLKASGLEAHELIADRLIELIELRQTHKNLSVADLAAFLLAKMLDATLLTGDWRLIDLAKANGLPAHGVLWLLDEMVRFEALTQGQAAVALRRMLERGARLPVQECDLRLARWKE